MIIADVEQVEALERRVAKLEKAVQILASLVTAATPRASAAVRKILERAEAER